MVSLAATLGAGPYPKVGGFDDAAADFRAVISVAGAYDLNALSWGDLWTPLTGDPREARLLASPIAHVSRSNKPILIIHSDDDRSVPIQQAIDMAEALKKAGVQSRFVHFTDRGGAAQPENTQDFELRRRGLLRRTCHRQDHTTKKFVVSTKIFVDRIFLRADTWPDRE